MKNLVVYYSRSGNTETVATELAKLVNGEIKKIELEKDISFIKAGYTSLLEKKGKIKEVDFSINNYDNIFIGSPVWAGKSSTPINTLLSDCDFTGKNVFVFITQGDNRTPKSVYDSISARVKLKGGNVIDNLFIQTSMKKKITPNEVSHLLTEWIDKNKYYL